VHCGVWKQFHEGHAVTIYGAANGWVYGAAEPQCRRDNWVEYHSQEESEHGD